MEIRSARSPPELRDAAHLMVALVDSNKQRYSDQIALLDEYYKGSWFFESEPQIPKQYCPPDGDVLIAYDDDGAPVGTVAICRMDSLRCELKSMFVPVSHRGKGVAQALCRAVLEVAGNLGYRCVRLTTGEKQPEAQALYRKLGFSTVTPWDPDPPAGFDYFELPLDETV